MKDLFERRPRPTSTGEGTAHSDSGSSSRPNSLHSPPHLPRGTRFKQHEPPGNFSDDDLEDMWDDALNDYFARTGMDLSDRDQDLYRRLQRCSSSESVARTLDEIALEFRTYRKGSRRAAKIRSVLSSVAHGVSNLIDAGAESAASKAFPGGKAVFVAIAVLIRATQGVSKHFDTLLAILDKFGFYLSRLRIRLHVGLGPESRRITVELLSKMVHAFALATETMHHNRLHHFVNVLFNKDDEVGIVGQRVSQLMEEDSRMDLVEIHRAVSNLSDEMDKALAPLRDELANIHTELQVNTEITQSGFATLSAELTTSGVFAMPKQLLAVAARCEEKSLAQRLQVVELELENIRLRKVVAHKEGSSTLWQLRASMSSLNSTTLTRIFNELQASFLVLTPDDQSALKQGIATLYSIAATTVTAGSGGDTFNAWFAVWLNPGAVFAAFLPMAAVYIIAYLCWRRMRLLTPANVSRGLREARMDTIMLIDVLGVHMLLPLDRVSTWRDFHDILLHQFANREGAEYVKRQAYRITDAAEESAIEPHSWLQSVRAGMTLDMSILVHLQLLGCPYCGNLTGEYLQEGQRTPCLKCGRQYWVTRRSQNASDVDVESASSTLQAPSDDAHATASMSHSPESYRPGMRSARASQDMSMFRRITIVLEEAFNNSGDLPYAHSQTKDSQQRHVDDENAPTQESALGLAFNTTSASTVKQDEDPLVALDEIQASSTFEQFSPSEFFQEDDGQSTFNGPLPLQSHDYDADHSLPQSPLKKEGYLPPRKFPSSPGHPSRAVESARPGPQAPGDGPYVDFVEYSPNARHLIVHYSKDQTARVFEPRSPPSDFPPSSSSWPPSPGTPPPRSPPGWKRHLPPYPGEAFARARAEARHRAQAEALLALAPENENGTQVSVL